MVGWQGDVTAEKRAGDGIDAAANILSEVLAPGMRVFVAGSSNEPRTLIDGLLRRPEAARGVSFLQFPLPGLNQTDFSALHPGAAMTTFFLTPQLRAGHAVGRVRFLPMHMRGVFDYLRDGPLDVALLQVAEDRDGTLRTGPNVDFHAAAMAAAGTVVAELNHSIVAPAGAPRVDRRSLDHVVESQRGQLVAQPPVVDETAAAIGRHVASVIRDGDCLQTGIGAIPAAVLAALGDKNDLGWHGGLIDDGGLALIERGVMTSAAKTRDRHRHVAGMVLGSAEALARAAALPALRLAGADVTHDARAIAAIDHFVSINGAVEVDLHGQVNAEVVAGRQISGTGGAVDFMRGARLSRGGRSIVAMTATARGGTISRIVPQVGWVTAPRADVDLVATEYGVAKLFGATEAARRAALIDIAHPDFRAALADG